MSRTFLGVRVAELNSDLAAPVIDFSAYVETIFKELGFLDPIISQVILYDGSTNHIVS